MSKQNYKLDFARQRVKGIFFCKSNASREDCRKLVEDLGCMILTESQNRLTIQTSRVRLKELKELYLSPIEDKAEISSRLKNHFERILIGGTAR